MNKSIRISARALILNKEKELLLVAHEDKALWYTPGGGVEFEEDIKQAVKREIYEETGITVDCEKLVYIRETIDFRKEEKRHSLSLYFLAETNEQLPQNWQDPGGPVTHVKFFSRKELEKEENILPDFLKDQFWKDLAAGFPNHPEYQLKQY